MGRKFNYDVKTSSSSAMRASNMCVYDWKEQSYSRLFMAPIHFKLHDLSSESDVTLSHHYSLVIAEG